MKKLLRETLPMAVALTVVLLVRTVAAEPYTVPTGSMIPTLLIGDKLIASKFAYGYSKYSSPIGLMPEFDGRVLDREPERGDVIVFKLPRDTSENYVKRLIGLPGDRVQMRNGRLHINGAMVPRRAAGTFTTSIGGSLRAQRRYVETLPNAREHIILEISDSGLADDTQEYAVPHGHYFMMGDNRDNSIDSRMAAFDGGVDFVPAENLIGRADIVLYSVDEAAPWWRADKWVGALRSERFFAGIN